MQSTMHRKACYFGGRVQGVGFRCTVRNLAQQYAIDGYVKNLPDGRVELVMEGSDAEIDELVQSVRHRMNGFIKTVDQVELPATGEFHQFSIRH